MNFYRECFGGELKVMAYPGIVQTETAQSQSMLTFSVSQDWSGNK